jgi:membrane protein required for colicin V production
MNGLDYFLIAVGFFCLVRGTLRGAISQLCGMAGVISGFLLAAHSYESLARQLSALFPGLPAAAAVSFIALFLLTWFCVGVTGYWTGRLLRRTGLGFLDRLLGGLVGLTKALVLAIMIVALLTLLLSPKSSFLTHSYLAPYVQQAAQLLLKTTPKSLQKLFEEKQKAFRHDWSEWNEERIQNEIPSQGKVAGA